MALRRISRATSQTSFLPRNHPNKLLLRNVVGRYLSASDRAVAKPVEAAEVDSGAAGEALPAVWTKALASASLAVGGSAPDDAVQRVAAAILAREVDMRSTAAATSRRRTAARDRHQATADASAPAPRSLHEEYIGMIKDVAPAVPAGAPLLDAVLRACFRGGAANEALSVVRDSRVRHLVRPATVVTLLVGLRQRGLPPDRALEAGLKVFGAFTGAGVAPTIAAVNGLLALGPPPMHVARRVWDELPSLGLEPNVETATLLLSAARTPDEVGAAVAAIKEFSKFKGVPAIHAAHVLARVRAGESSSALLPVRNVSQAQAVGIRNAALRAMLRAGYVQDATRVWYKLLEHSQPLSLSSADARLWSLGIWSPPALVMKARAEIRSSRHTRREAWSSPRSKRRHRRFGAPLSAPVVCRHVERTTIMALGLAGGYLELSGMLAREISARVSGSGRPMRNVSLLVSALARSGKPEVALRHAIDAEQAERQWRSQQWQEQSSSRGSRSSAESSRAAKLGRPVVSAKAYCTIIDAVAAVNELPVAVNAAHSALRYCSSHDAGVPNLVRSRLRRLCRRIGSGEHLAHPAEASGERQSPGSAATLVSHAHDPVLMAAMGHAAVPAKSALLTDDALLSDVFDALLARGGAADSVGELDVQPMVEAIAQDELDASDDDLPVQAAAAICASAVDALLATLAGTATPMTEGGSDGMTSNDAAIDDATELLSLAIDEWPASSAAMGARSDAERSMSAAELAATRRRQRIRVGLLSGE